MLNTTMLQTVTGFWKDEPQHTYTVKVSLGTWDGRDDLSDLGIFYYTDGDQIKVGDTIAEDFIITSIQAKTA
tara:strand:- start:284 stop:499 length:216 start_codon:yes stop_codon:yes gene_type:complete